MEFPNDNNNIVGLHAIVQEFIDYLLCTSTMQW